MGNRADAAVLWHAWTDGWTGAGLGGPDPVGPWAPLLALPTWLVDHLPLLPDPGVRRRAWSSRSSSSSGCRSRP